ncbi:SCO family protein [Bacillus sp. DTU_2020_1000418_1_SI_GHA_SEK_038]|uniref:SCO family protein n=1 Tax=Bacillus sp. DTU_2020_1000418_1_SI_GHA_SEK_038 TaxID=3077585 RepID=UPI0028E4B565|nr:SCO family protein [Bacillus sp. DTU_2020_1000418_1_SI_GHA_SEK_038]WNS73903.1 SCO family protein [Bacillus sp. DTU_2020_1000418_1_SI_GHA_SEK_038]
MKFRFMTIILSILTVLILSACGQSEIKDAKNWPVADFTFTDQNNKSLGLSDLKGKVWVADFIYTNCPDVCLPMTFNMAKLQDLAKKEEIENIEFVSFSIDPEIDSPEVLTAYAGHFDVDFNNWHFLTGYKQEEIEKFAMDNFKTLVKKPENDPNVIHQTYFYLVNGEGKIMKLYSGLDDIPFEEIINDIKTLQ